MDGVGELAGAGAHLRVIRTEPRPRVLLADGDLGRRATLQVAVSVRYAPQAAASAAEALALAAAGRFDVAVLDAAMLDASLARVVTLLRRHAAGVGVLLITGRRDLRARNQAVWLAIDAVLARPVAAHVLLDRIHALTAKRERLVRTHRTVGAAMDLIAHDVSHLLDLEALAKAAGASRLHLDREFRANTGLGLGEYVHGVRLLVARQLLRDTALDVQTLVELLGFTDAGELTRWEVGRPRPAPQGPQT